MANYKCDFFTDRLYVLWFCRGKVPKHHVMKCGVEVKLHAFTNLDY
jgi:hypothetical protein